MIFLVSQWWIFSTYATAEFPVGHKRYKWEDRIIVWEKITELKNTSPVLFHYFSEQREFYLKLSILKDTFSDFSLWTEIRSPQEQ